MAISRECNLDALARLPFIDAGELAIVLGKPLATVHRALTALLRAGDKRQLVLPARMLDAGQELVQTEVPTESPCRHIRPRSTHP